MASSSNKEYIPGPDGIKLDDHKESIDIHLVVQGIQPPGTVGKGKTSVDAEFKEESLRILIEIVDKGKKDTRLYEVKQLPGKILPDKCNYTLKAGVCVIVLQKATPDSWENTVERYGLDISDTVFRK